MEVNIRCEMPADHEGIREVIREAFDRPNEARLVDALRASPSFIPELSLVADLNGRIVGHVLFSRLAVEGNGHPVELLALAPMAVLPECQRQGVGRHLIGMGLVLASMLGYS